MTRIIFDSNGISILSPNKKLVDVVITETPLPIGGSPVAETDRDLEYNRLSGASVLAHFSVEVVSDLPSTFSMTSSDETLAKISGNNVLDQDKTGSTDIIVSASGRAARRIHRSYKAAEIKDAFDSTGYIAGTLGSHILQSINDMLAGKTQSDIIQLYVESSNQDVDNPTVTINQDVFTGGLDFAATSVMRSDQPDDRYAPALVTNRHAIVATHTLPANGTKIVFRRADGTFQTVSVLDSFSTASGDISILYFDEEVIGITPYKVMASGWLQEYIPSLVDPFRQDGSTKKGIIPTIRKAMHSSASNIWGSYLLISTLSNYSSVTNSVNNTRSGIDHSGEIDSVWGEGFAISGDSGSPSFVLVSNELVLVTTQYYPSSSRLLSDFNTELTAAMNDMATAAGDANAGTYTFSYQDLTGFITLT